MDDPVDSVGPWTIKAVATKTREAVTNAARREGLTVGQWLERRVREWEEGGGPVHVQPGAQASVADALAVMQARAASTQASAALVQAVASLAQQAGGISPGLMKETDMTARRAMRQARQAPRLLAAPSPQTEG